jgi:hypothetical protein
MPNVQASAQLRLAGGAQGAFILFHGQAEGAAGGAQGAFILFHGQAEGADARGLIALQSLRFHVARKSSSC